MSNIYSIIKHLILKSVTVHTMCDQQRISPFLIAFGNGAICIQVKTRILRVNQRSD
jgi:hypothetical protein